MATYYEWHSRRMLLPLQEENDMPDTSARAENKNQLVPETPLRARMPELDTLRGVAVLLVLFFHGFGFEFTTRGLSAVAEAHGFRLFC